MAVYAAAKPASAQPAFPAPSAAAAIPKPSAATLAAAAAATQPSAAAADARGPAGTAAFHSVRFVPVRLQHLHVHARRGHGSDGAHLGASYRRLGLPLLGVNVPGHDHQRVPAVDCTSNRRIQLHSGWRSWRRLLVRVQRRRPGCDSHHDAEPDAIPGDNHHRRPAGATQPRDRVSGLRLQRYRRRRRRRLLRVQRLHGARCRRRGGRRVLYMRQHAGLVHVCELVNIGCCRHSVPGLWFWRRRRPERRRRRPRQ